MQKSIEELRSQFLELLDQTKSTHALEQVKVKFLGKKGPLQLLMQNLREVSSAERPLMGKLINDLKEEITSRIEDLRRHLTLQEESEKQAREAIDISFPGRKKPKGRAHPLTQMMDQIIAILSEMGFTVQYGPEIDTDYYNFEVLNFPPDHPARDMQDTFYISPHHLLRTQTSNIQARVMEVNRPPIRIIAPGKVYRNETITARSHVIFHQVEAVYVDRNVTFVDLLGTLDSFLGKLFKPGIKTRFRPSYFPFVEPGIEVDISCLACNGKGCSLCKQTGWLEILGAGMIHPEVLKNAGIDPEQYSGYAWGLGVERVLMMLKGIHDIRLFAENDMRFLNQFTAS